MAAYVAAILLYMANGGADVDNTARQYMRQAVGDEPVKVSWGGAKTAEQTRVLPDPRDGHYAEILALDEEKGGGVTDARRCRSV